MFTEHVQSRAAQRDLTRQRVLASAERLFRERGFDATTVRQIAAEAGVSTGSVMAVGDKDALLVAIFDGWISAVHDERMGAPHSGDPVAEILALIEPFVDYFARDRDLSRHYAAIIVRGTHDSEIFRNLGLALVSEITDVVASSGVPAAEAERRARAVYFGYLGILMTRSNGALPDDLARELFRDLVELVVGTTHSPEPAPKEAS